MSSDKVVCLWYDEHRPSSLPIYNQFDYSHTLERLLLPVLPMYQCVKIRKEEEGEKDKNDLLVTKGKLVGIS